MGCRFCVHWKGGEATETWFGDNDIGACRRFPKEETTKSSYYCGELKMEHPSYVNMFYKQRDKYWKMYKSEREARLKLEKTLKLRNSQLKDNKRKA